MCQTSLYRSETRFTPPTTAVFRIAILLAMSVAPAFAAQTGVIYACYACQNTGNAVIDAALAANPGVGSDGILFAFINTSAFPITGGVFSVTNASPADSFALPTIAAGSVYILIPGISADGGAHPSNGLFANVGSAQDTSDGSGGVSDSSVFKFTGFSNGSAVISTTFGSSTGTPGTFTPADPGLILPWRAPAGGGSTSFIGLGPNGDGGCNNCYYGQVATLNQPAAGLDFYPVTPCRIADTRTAAGFTGQFGPPSMAGGATRTFNVLSSPCAAGIPSTVAAYSLNFTAIPPANGPAANLTTWPTGQPTMPNVSTLNFSGSVVANAAIVPAGSNGAINVFVNDPTDVLFDIDGYFAPPVSSGLEFFPVTPCRIADTRTGAGFTGQFGPPSMPGGSTRTFAIPSSSCGIPATANAYSLNFTVVPPNGGPAANLTSWPATQPAMPNVSTLNFSGFVVANAAIVPAGTNDAINVFVNDPTDVLFDTNGYFAPGMAGLHFYPVTPCRVADTRAAAGFTGQFGPPSMAAGTTRPFNIPASSCGIPSTASAYSLNFTVIPPSGGPAANLTTWPVGASTMPNVSTLNFYGSIVANAAVVPAGTNGAINVFVNLPTDVLFDINGYFAQ